ncbi:MAG: thiamine pyrophosphate-dependent enzyme, partial [Mariprofundales bacterium]|nr:thiamine pyrophosphate-dependent enzyme [Mariprofundales bacterium]
PIVFVIENNQYAMGTALNRASAETHLYKRGISFKVPGMQVDGMDVLEVVVKTAEARAHAAAGEGPMILEMITYRYRGHSMSDPATYRSRAEVDEWRSGRDPIAHLQQQMIELGIADALALKERDKVIKSEVNAIAQAAEAQSEPDGSSMWQHVYAEPIEHAYPYPGEVTTG